jgi:hypothetical protein
MREQSRKFDSRKFIKTRRNSKAKLHTEHSYTYKRKGTEISISSTSLIFFPN